MSDNGEVFSSRYITWFHRANICINVVAKRYETLAWYLCVFIMFMYALLFQMTCLFLKGVRKKFCYLCFIWLSKCSLHIRKLHTFLVEGKGPLVGPGNRRQNITKTTLKYDVTFCDGCIWHTSIFESLFFVNHGRQLI